MKKHLILFLLLSLVAGSLTASAQQRVEFQRQKFDRTRFERPDPATRLEPPQTPPPPAPAPWPAHSQPMVTQPPAAADEPEFRTPAATDAAAAQPAAPAPDAYAPPGTPPEEQARIDQPLFELVPNKWFNSAKDFEKLLELQKESGACMLVYFNNQIDSSQKGLCNWFEKKVTTDMSWRKAMKFYIQFQVILPGKKDAQALVEKFRVNKTPALFVVKPFSTFYTRIQVFEFPVGDRPIPIEADVVLESIKAASTPAYKDKF